MKKLLSIMLVLTLLLTNISTVFAGTDEIPINTVADISNYYEYAPANLTTKKLTASPTSVYKFTLTNKAVITISKTKESVLLRNSDSTDYKSKAKSKLEIYQDSQCTRLLGTVEDEYGGPYHLEKGTYYVKQNYGDLSAYQYVIGNLEVAVVAQYISTDEGIVDSTFYTPNNMTLGKGYSVFVSDNYPSKWVKFYVSQPQLIKLSFLKEVGKGEVNVDLYNSNRIILESRTVKDDNNQQDLNIYLDKGFYYLSLNSIGGKIKINSSLLTYKINSIKSFNKKPTNEKVKYLFSTNFDYDSAFVVDANRIDVDENNKDSNILSNYTVCTATNGTFEIDASGKYTLIIRDKDGNSVYKNFKVTNIDTVAPTKISLTSYKKGSKTIKGKTESYGKVILNIRKYDKNGNVKNKWYTKKASKSGAFAIKLKYKLTKDATIFVKVKDAAGNVSVEKTYTIK